MSGIQQKITRHANKKKNTTHKEEKSKSIESNPEMSQTKESVDKDVHVFEKQQKRQNVLETLRL